MAPKMKFPQITQITNNNRKETASFYFIKQVFRCVAQIVFMIERNQINIGSNAHRKTWELLEQRLPCDKGQNILGGQSGTKCPDARILSNRDIISPVDRMRNFLPTHPPSGNFRVLSLLPIDGLSNLLG